MDQVLEALGISSAGAVFSAALTMLVCLIAIKVVTNLLDKVLARNANNP